MIIDDRPSIVSAIQVGRFMAELQKVEVGSAFAVSLQPRPQERVSATQIETDLLTLTRLSAQATYQLGTRIVKIANLGDWSGLPVDEQPAAAETVASVLHTLVRDDVASLEAFDSWSDLGPPTTTAYRESIRNVRNTLGFLGAMNVHLTEMANQLDLWFEYSTTPFRFHDERLIRGSERYMLSGHLIRVTPPAIDWTGERSALLTSCASPLAVSVTPLNLAFAHHVADQLRSGPVRPVILRFDPSDSTGSTVGSDALLSLLGELSDVTGNVIVGCTISDDTSQVHVDEMMDVLGAAGVRLGCLDVRLGDRAEESVNIASDLINQLSQ